jgi:hypothetical protein
VKAPCNFNDSADYFAVYESSDLIKDFVLSRNEDEFYLVDRTGGVKIVRLERISESYSRETLKVSKDYFVEKNFIGGVPFNLSDSVMYYGFKGYLLQNMKYKNEELTTEYDLNLDEYLKPVDMPLISKDTIVFIGQAHSYFKDKNSLYFEKEKYKRVACLMPRFNEPNFLILSDRERKAIRNEFFFKPPNYSDELIVYQLQSGSKDYIEFSFYKTNGQYINSIHHKVENVTNYDELEVKLSPDGKMLFYKIEVKDEENEFLRYDGMVYQFVMLRTKSEINKQIK